VIDTQLNLTKLSSSHGLSETMEKLTGLKILSSSRLMVMILELLLASSRGQLRLGRNMK
jgi:hypothetical protein